MKSIRKPERNSVVTRERLVISRLARTAALARHLIENGIITPQEFFATRSRKSGRCIKGCSTHSALNYGCRQTLYVLPVNGTTLFLFSCGCLRICFRNRFGLCFTIPRFFGVVFRHEFATFSFAVELAFFMVNFAGEVNPDHSLRFRVGNLFVRGCWSLLASLCA